MQHTDQPSRIRRARAAAANQLHQGWDGASCCNCCCGGSQIVRPAVSHHLEQILYSLRLLRLAAAPQAAHEGRNVCTPRLRHGCCRCCCCCERKRRCLRRWGRQANGRRQRRAAQCGERRRRSLSGPPMPPTRAPQHPASPCSVPSGIGDGRRLRWEGGGRARGGGLAWERNPCCWCAGSGVGAPGSTCRGDQRAENTAEESRRRISHAALGRRSARCPPLLAAAATQSPHAFTI